MNCTARYLRHLAFGAAIAVSSGLALADAAKPISSATASGAATSGEVPDRTEPIPEQYQKVVEKVGVDEQLGNAVPLDKLQFVDTSGRPVTLSKYFNQGRPVVLQMGYFRCPQICDVVSQSLMNAAKAIDLEIGKDYDVLYVSIDPDERWQLGLEKKRNYVEEYGKPGAVTGWNFVVGSEAHIAKLAESIGFKYEYLPEVKQYAHPSMLTVLSADGKVSRYLYGANFAADDKATQAFRLAIVEAKQGKVGDSLGDRLLMLCFHYDGYSGKYTPRWMGIMRVGGVLMVLAVGTCITSMLVRESRSRRKAKLTIT